MAANYNLEILQGANFSMILTIKDSLDVPIDLTGHVFRGQIRRTVSDTEVQASFVFVLLDQTNILTRGKVSVSLSSEASRVINLGNQNSIRKTIVQMPYDIESIFMTDVTRWLEGLVNLSPEITR
jgi:hypothetical protein